MRSEEVREGRGGAGRRDGKGDGPIAAAMNRTPFKFLTSHLVPLTSASPSPSPSPGAPAPPALATDTLTSHLSSPLSMLAPLAPTCLSAACSVRTNAAASSGDWRSGRVTTSMRAAPERFRSTRVPPPPELELELELEG